MEKEKKEPMRIKLSTAILVFIVLLLIIAIVGIVYYYQNKLNSVEENKVQNETTNTVDQAVTELNEVAQNNSNVEENKIEELDVNSKTIQELYKYVEKSNVYQELNVYETNKVTASDMTNTLKLATVFSNLKESDANDKKVTEQNGTEITNLYYKSSTVEEEAKKIFGNNTTIIHEDLPDGLGYAIKYENGQYHCFNFQGGGGFLWEESINAIEKAERDNDNIYIYDKYAHIYTNYYDKAECDYDVFSASDKKEKVASKVNLSKISDGIVSYENDTEVNNKKIENIEKLASEKIKTFKHTFKKNADGSYYWYSTEPIN